jgi:RNA polymerase sigma factor (sigma-70 family)
MRARRPRRLGADAMMSDSVWASLRRTIILRYDEIKVQLTRSLGSRELADDVLHETFLRLHQSEAAGMIRQPESYIFRVALNIATDKRREERRRASQAEVLAAIRLHDAQPDLSREIEARSDIEALKRALAELPPRCRAILIAARVHGLSHEAIAERSNISRTMVQKDLRRAVHHCVEYLEKKVAGGEPTASQRRLTGRRGEPPVSDD